MYKIFDCYKLKPDVKIEDYRRWSVEDDQVITPRQPGVLSFEAYEVMDVAGGREQYHVVEVITVESWEAWQNALKTDDMKKIAAAWMTMADDKSELMLVTHKIESTKGR